MYRILTVLAVLGGAILVAPPSHASGSISASSGVLYDDCRMHPYTYSLSLPPGTDSWSMSVSAVGPDGTEEASDYVYDDVTTGTGGLQFCGGELPGAYQLVADVEYTDYDASGGGTTTERFTATFSMRLPMTKTRLRVSDRTPRYNSVVRFVIRTKDERPSGYFPTSTAWVRLQVRAQGRWRNVRGAKVLTDSRGKAVLAYRWDVRRRLTLRALTLGSSSATASWSRPVAVTTTQ